MRRPIDNDLNRLRQRLMHMAGIAERMVDRAIVALVDRKPDLFHGVLEDEAEVNRLHLEIDDQCLSLLALHQPLAADLRAIMAAGKIGSELERIGDQAVNMVETGEYLLKVPPVNTLIDIPRMAEIVREMLRDALCAFVLSDLEKANAVLKRDDVVDALKSQIFRVLLAYMLADPSKIEPGMELILISRNLERIGDHATNIAEDAIFAAAGKDVRHKAFESKEPVAPAASDGENP